MHNNGGGGLFRNELISRAKRNAEFRGNSRKQLEHFSVIFQFWNGRIAPRIAFALVLRDAHFTPDVFMQIVRCRFRRLDSKPVGEVGFCVIMRGLKFVKAFGGFLPNSDDLECNHIHLTRLNRSKIVGEGKVVVVRLTREAESSNRFIQVFWIVYDQVIAFRLAGEESIDSLRGEPFFMDCFALHPVEACIELGLELIPLFAMCILGTPRQAIEFIEVEMGEHNFEWHVIDDTHAELGSGRVSGEG